jgi:superfamily II RNA helicase
MLLGWHKVFGVLFQVAVDCKMTMDIEDYATSFRPDIIDAVSGWCQGATFAKVLTLTDVFEVGLRVQGCLAGIPF